VLIGQLFKSVCRNAIIVQSDVVDRRIAAGSLENPVCTCSFLPWTLARTRRDHAMQKYPEV
jgi:hypothetical protein